MGLLDPKIDKERTFELLREKDAVQAILTFSGGHDEGSVETITLTLKGGQEVDLPTWYCGGYRMGPNGRYVPVSEPANTDEELADLLEGPINGMLRVMGLRRLDLRPAHLGRGEGCGQNALHPRRGAGVQGHVLVNEGGENRGRCVASRGIELSQVGG